MPGNEIEDKIRILYELGNVSLGQHRSQSVDDSHSVLIYDQWLEKQRQSFNLKNSTVEQFDSFRGHGSEPLSPFDQNYGQSTQRPDFYRSESINQELNTHGFMLEQQNFQEKQNQLDFLGDITGAIPHNLMSRGLSVLKSQQEYAPVDSPTLTTNSERSEMTDASTEFNFIGGQQHVSGQQPGIHQPTPVQQSGYNDAQLLQQQIMLKKLQELQRQQQLQQFGDARQLNSLHQHSSLPKQASGVPYSTLINGALVNDASQMYMNWVQRGASPAAQGMSNRDVFSQEQGQNLRSMPVVSQQFDVSLYGTPVASARGTTNHYSNVQGMSHDSSNLLNKVSGQTQKPVVQSTAGSKPFISGQCTISPDQVISKSGLHGKNMFGQAPFLQDLHSNTTATFGNSLLERSLQANASLHDLTRKQDLVGWPAPLQQKTMQHDSSNDLVSLDPMEEKILYDTDDNVWNDSFSGHSDMDAGGFGTLEQIETLNACPSIQSGSWSALMQSAVVEASSSDTGLQEEWSGLTIENAELSTDNRTSNILDNDKQQRDWTDNNLQNESSLSSKSPIMLNDSSVSTSFPGFHPTGTKFMTNQREDLCQEDSHESIRNSPKDTRLWLDYNPQPTLPKEGNEQVQRFLHPWAGQINKVSENNAHQQSIPSYKTDRSPTTKPEGHTNEAMYNKSDSDGFPWKAGTDSELTSVFRSTGGFTQLQSDNALLSKESSHLFNSSAVSASRIAKPQQETSQQVADGNQIDYMKQVKISMNNEENENIGVKHYQMGNISNVMQNSYSAAETFRQQQNCYPRDNSYDSYSPEGLKIQKQVHTGQFKFMGDVSSLNKGHLPNLLGNSRGDFDVSANFHRSMGFGGPFINAQTSQDMLQLLPKVDQSKENVAVSGFGSTGYSPSYELSKTGNAQGYIAQTYNQSSGSQGFSLRLSPPQRVANPNGLFCQGSSQNLSDLNVRHGHYDPGEKNQTQLNSPSSFQSPPASNEFSPRDRWDDKFNIAERMDMASSLYLHQSSVAAMPSIPPISRNQLQMQFMSNGPTFYPSQATLHDTAHPPFNLASSQDTSQHTHTKTSGQQFQGLEAVAAPQFPVVSNIPQQGGFSGMPQSLLTNTHQHLSAMKSYKVPSSNSTETTLLTQQEPNNQHSQKAEYDPSRLSTSSINSQGSVFDEDQSIEDGSQKLKSPRVLKASQAGAKSVSDKINSHQQDLDRLHQTHSHSLTTSERSHESLGDASKPSHGFRQNYSLLHQVQAMKNVETGQSRTVLNAQRLTAIPERQSAYDHHATYNSMDSALHINSSCGDTKMAIQDIPSQGMVSSRQNDFHSQPNVPIVISNNAENSLANLNTAPSWFKQYETSRNGQMPPIFEAKLADTARVQFSLVKPSQTFDIHSSVGRPNVLDATQSGVWPSTTTADVASKAFSASNMASSAVTDQTVATERPNKRKTMASGRLPWHKEVTQGSKRSQDISIAEQEWARASNRLIEKMEEDAGVIGLPLLRKKRRLILTTQLMQQLFCPPPAPVFTANAALHYDSVIYYVARFLLGDTCSLVCGKRNDLGEPINGNMILEELNNSECTDVQHFSKAVEVLTSRSKKLESDLLSLDKATSILELKMECQELEKVSIVHRFARFHTRPPGVSGTTASSETTTLNPCPQRFIIAVPMPENVPDGVQCLSL